MECLHSIDFKKSDIDLFIIVPSKEKYDEAIDIVPRPRFPGFSPPM